MDFQTFLDIKPDPSELTKHVNTSKWYCLGSKLNCDRTKLDEIGELSESDACKTKLLFEHLCASTATSRRQVLEVLRMNLIQEDEVANEYEEFLKGHHAATWVVDFEKFLDIKPDPSELTKHVNTSKWYRLGSKLNCNHTKLDEIGELSESDACKTKLMFEHLCASTATSRRQVLEVLRMNLIQEDEVANEYEEFLKGHHAATSTILQAAVTIFEGHIASLRQADFDPIQVSQVLYSISCINETTLDEMEEVIDQSKSPDDRKDTLLSAINESVSKDYRKLKDIAKLLSHFDETRIIADKILAEYGENIQEEECRSHEISPIVTDGKKNLACDLLKKNYSDLCQLLMKPLYVAAILHTENIMSTLKFKKDSPSERRAAVLKAVRHAVRDNYKNLELFVTVLQKFPETLKIGHCIFQEYKKAFPNDKEISELSCFAKLYPERDFSDSDNKGSIYYYRQTSLVLNFGATFFQIRHAIKRKQVNLKKIKCLLADDFPCILEFHDDDLSTVHELLEVVKGNCNLIDISCLEIAVEAFEVLVEAIPHLEAYKKKVEEFCQKSCCRGVYESLEVVRSPQPLSCENLVFVLYLGCTIRDIRDVVAKFSKLQAKILYIECEEYVHVTCYVPMKQNVVPAVKDLVLQHKDSLQSMGLKEFHVANNESVHLEDIVQVCVTFKHNIEVENDLKRKLAEKDENIKRLIKGLSEQNDAFNTTKKVLHAQLQMTRMKSFQIEDERRKFEIVLKDKEKEIENLKISRNAAVKELEYMNTVQQKKKMSSLAVIGRDPTTNTDEDKDINGGHKTDSSILDSLKSVFSDLKELLVDSKKCYVHHCPRYDVTLTIPKGALEKSTTVQFGASFYSDVFQFGDHEPMTPIVWIYADQKLLKPAELILPHHYGDDESQLLLMTADNETYEDKNKLLFVVNKESTMKTEDRRCIITCHSFSSFCCAAKGKEHSKFIVVAMIERKKGISKSVKLRYFLDQSYYEKQFNEMIAKKGYKVKFAKIKLDWEGLRVTFNPVAIQGLERYFHGFFNDNYQLPGSSFDYALSKHPSFCKQSFEFFYCTSNSTSHANMMTLTVLSGTERLNLQIKLTDIINITQPVSEQIPLPLSVRSSMNRQDVSAPKKAIQSTSAGTELGKTDLHKVLKTLKNVHFDTSKWKCLGLSLGLFSNTLNALQAGDSEQLLMETLEAWLKKQDNVETKRTTLENLVEAVRDTGDNAAAGKIIEVYGSL